MCRQGRNIIIKLFYCEPRIFENAQQQRSTGQTTVNLGCASKLKKQACIRECSCTLVVKIEHPARASRSIFNYGSLHDPVWPWPSLSDEPRLAGACDGLHQNVNAARQQPVSAMVFLQVKESHSPACSADRVINLGVAENGLCHVEMEAKLSEYRAEMLADKANFNYFQMEGQSAQCMLNLWLAAFPCLIASSGIRYLSFAQGHYQAVE